MPRQGVQLVIVASSYKLLYDSASEQGAMLSPPLFIAHANYTRPLVTRVTSNDAFVILFIGNPILPANYLIITFKQLNVKIQF